MTTRHTGCRFARHLENIPQVSVKGGGGVEDVVESNDWWFLRPPVSQRHSAANRLPVWRFVNCLWRFAAVWVYWTTLISLLLEESRVSLFFLLLFRFTDFYRRYKYISLVLLVSGCFLCFFTYRHLLWRVVRFESNRVESSTFATLYSF